MIADGISFGGPCVCMNDLDIRSTRKTGGCKNVILEFDQRIAWNKKITVSGSANRFAEGPLSLTICWQFC